MNRHQKEEFHDTAVEQYSGDEELDEKTKEDHKIMKSNFSRDNSPFIPLLIVTSQQGKSKMAHSNDESPFTFIIEHVHHIGIVVVDIQIHDELNEHNVEQQSSDSL